MKSSRNQRAQNPRLPRRRGISAVFVAIILVVIFGFVAFAVDIGRMQLAKTELQGAADAAARAGAWYVYKSRSQARMVAVSAAAANVALQQSVSLHSTDDVEIGFWDKGAFTFTPLADTDLSTANAVRTTARRIAARNDAVPLIFAPVIGINSSDVQATAIAYRPMISLSYGLVGIDWVSMNGITTTDSYDSTVAPYDPNSPGENGDVITNGTMDLTGEATIHGTGYVGPDEPLPESENDKAGATEGFENLPEELVFPPVDSDPYVTDNNNSALPSSVYNATTHDFDLGPNPNPLILEGGTTDYVRYYFRDFTLRANANLQLSGKVEICVTGQLDIAGAVSTYNSSPGNFRINVSGPGAVRIHGASDLYADVYAPEADVEFGGLGADGSGLYGALVGKTLTVKGNADLHYDESLRKTIEIPGKVVLVK